MDYNRPQASSTPPRLVVRTYVDSVGKRVCVIETLPPPSPTYNWPREGDSSEHCRPPSWLVERSYVDSVRERRG